MESLATEAARAPAMPRISLPWDQGLVKKNPETGLMFFTQRNHFIYKLLTDFRSPNF